jgi:hypothetical protein
MKTTRIGDIGVLSVARDLTRRGHHVSLPFAEDCRYGLFLYEGDRLYRMQVKAARSNGKVIRVRCTSCSTWAQKTSSYYSCAEGCVDYLAVYDLTTDTMAYVPDADRNATLLDLRLSPPTSGQKAGIRFASDYAYL